MEDVSKGGPVARFVGRLIMTLILVNAILVFAHAQQGLPTSVYTFFAILEAISTACFAVEYAVRIWVADIVYPHKTPARARLKYILSLMGIVDLLAFAPGIIAIVIPSLSVATNALRVIRLVRFIKISRYMVGLQSISKVVSSRRHEIIAAFLVLGLLTVTASVLMYTVENPAQPEVFDSVFTGMYWAVTTITSTGFGDIVPITPIGRFIGTVTMLLSIAVVAIPAGIFSAGFVNEFRDENIHKKQLGHERGVLGRKRNETHPPESDVHAIEGTAEAFAAGSGEKALHPDDDAKA